MPKDQRPGEHLPPSNQRPDRLAYRMGELARALGISRRTLERERSAGRFPPPDLTIGKAPLWRPETIARWLDAGGKGVS
jgi:predicted DNA-binding transcriptional regulator AlpA